jgi:hypothetical protein
LQSLHISVPWIPCEPHPAKCCVSDFCWHLCLVPVVDKGYL